MTQDELIKQMESTARHCRSIGMTVEINNSLPYVAVDLGPCDCHLGDRHVYFFQGEEASDLLDEVPDWINEDDYILWSAQGWG
jgi:hypothetical protein